MIYYLILHLFYEATICNTNKFQTEQDRRRENSYKILLRQLDITYSRLGQQ